MDPNDLIAKLQSFVYVLRRGRLEQILALLAVSLPILAGYLRQWKDIPQAAYIAYGAYALCAISGLWLVVRIWKQAAVPPPPPDVPVHTAIKGLLPFTVADGKLFARLGRRAELQSLLALSQDDQIGISVVRGESGAGKTSLLQAGLAYALGEGGCIYWEAVPAKAPEAMLHAIRSVLPDVESVESLPEACPKRCVLLLDQFEQLRASEPEHEPVFALLERVAKAPAPHKLSVIVGFRREYAADWLDFEQTRCFRAEQVAINLLAPRTASDTLVTLASEAGFTLEQKLVENFISSVQRPQGVSPVDIAIGVLSLANFVQQRGSTHVGMAEYELAGGAEGLLLAFVQQKLEEIPESIRAPLLKGIVLALVDLSNNQRIAEGATAAAIAPKAETPESSLLPWLERLAHPRIRLLEKPEPGRYRLPHERLVPVLRRLTGATLASIDQLRLVFEGEYASWRETRSRRHLLGGKELRKVLHSRDLFVQGENAAAKAEYLTSCLRRRAILQLAAGAALVAATVSGYVLARGVDSSIQQEKLKSWGLPRELFKAQDAVDRLDVSFHAVNDLGWLRSTRLRELSLQFNGSSFKGSEHLKGLTSLSLDLRDSAIKDLEGLEPLKGLSSLTLNLGRSQIEDLKELEQLKGLTSLTLNLSRSQIKDLKDLESLNGLTSLTLDLYRSQIYDLKGLGQLKGLTSLTLVLINRPIRDLKELESLKGLTSLSLDLRNSAIKDLEGLKPLKGLTSLTLNLDDSQIEHLKELESLKGLTSLTLDLYRSQIYDLGELGPLKGLTSLTLHLLESPIKDLRELEPLQKLTSLTLRLASSDINDLKGLGLFKGLSSLTLDLGGSQIKDLKELEQLKGLTSLTLYLSRSQIKDLKELEQLKGLTSLELGIPVSLASDIAHLKIRHEITKLWIAMDWSGLPDIPTGYKFVGLTDHQY